jgi:D-alanine-D-alanine ligase
MQKECMPRESIEGLSPREIAPWKMEYDVCAALANLGHEVREVGVADDLSVVVGACAEPKPDVVFNLLETFYGERSYVPFVLAYLELIRQPYTGCNPAGMILTHSKALAKRILRSHRIRVPDFVVFEKGRRIRRPRRLEFPLIVKSVSEHGSVGIAQTSIVRDDDKLRERVEFIHEQLDTPAMAERYIDGREFYVGILGNRRLTTFPVWELTFDNLPEGVPRIATEKVKWDYGYQEKRGVMTRPADDLPPELAGRIVRISKRAYKALGQTGYARIDLRMDEGGELYFLESNPNPQLAYGEDFAESAEAGGIGYEPLIQRIVNLGLSARAHPAE